MCVEEGLVRCEVVGFGGGEGGVGGRVVEGVGVEGGAGEEGEGVGVDLRGVLATVVFKVFGSVGLGLWAVRGGEGGEGGGYLCDAGAEEGAHEELEAFEFCL